MNTTGHIFIHTNLIPMTFFRVDDKTFRTFYWMLFNASIHRHELPTGETVDRGEFIANYQEVAIDLYMSKSAVVRCFKKLANLEMITTTKNSSGTLVTVTNYKKYVREGSTS